MLNILLLLCGAVISVAAGVQPFQKDINGNQECYKEKTEANRITH